jgi:hypothetical protein
MQQITHYDAQYHTSSTFSRRNKLVLWVAFSGFCIFFDVCALLTNMFTVYTSYDVICLIMAVAFFLLDLKIVMLLQQPSLYSSGEKVFTLASLKDSIFGQNGLFESDSTTAGNMGSPQVGFDDVERGGKRGGGGGYNMEPVNLNRNIMETGNMGIMDTRSNFPLERPSS